MGLLIKFIPKKFNAQFGGLPREAQGHRAIRFKPATRFEWSSLREALHCGLSAAIPGPNDSYLIITSSLTVHSNPIGVQFKLTR